MDYTEQLDLAIERLHEEGRYRTFIDIERQKGRFPHAEWTREDGTKKDITVWCGVQTRFSRLLSLLPT